MRFLRNTVVAFAIISSLAHSPQAKADLVQLRGFSDIIATKSNTNSSLGFIPNDGQAMTIDRESRLGLNLSSEVAKNLSFAGQILAKGTSGKYSLTADWLFGTYRPISWFALRVGRQINPTLLYSEQVDVGYTYLWARLPGEVYNNDPVKSFNGLGAIFSQNFSDIAASIEFLYGGNETNFTTGIGSTAATYTGPSTNYLGAQLVLSTDYWKFATSYTQSDLDNASVSIQSTTPVSATQPTTYGTLNYNPGIGRFRVLATGASMDWKNIVAGAEYARVSGTGAGIRRNSSYYGVLGYRFFGVLTPYYTYAWNGAIEGTVYVNSANILTQSIHSHIGGLNYRVASSVVLKAEYDRSQQNYIVSSSNIGANTYTLSMDMVF